MTSDPALRRLVRAVLVPGFTGTTVPDWLARDLDAGLGGVCWFTHNVPDGDTARALSDELHRHRDDMLVLCDEEGGGVTRLEAATGSSWPGNAALGAVDDVATTETIGAGIGAQARHAGVDVVLAPVVDVNSDPDNPVIGVRSFGDRPDVVARHGAAFVRGLQTQGVAACAKHFPGHGATRVDSHLDLPVVDADRVTVMQRDVAPFAAAIDAGTRCMLTAHVSFPAVDPTPATMSAQWMSILRQDLAFSGVVISDALDMHAISGGVGRSAGAVAALQAGVDLVCIGNPAFPESYDADTVLDYVSSAVVAAVDDGTLLVERLEEAAGRIAALVGWLEAQRGSIDGGGARLAGTPSSDFSESLSDPVLAAGRDAARRAIRTIGDFRLAGAPLVIIEDHVSIAAGPQRSWVVHAFEQRRDGVRSVFVRTPDDLDALGWVWGGDHPVVLVTDGLAGDAVLRAVHARRGDVVVVWTGSVPSGGRHHVLAGTSVAVVYTFGAGRVNADAAAEVMMDRR